MKTIMQIWCDLRNGENIDLYITIAVASALVVADLFDFVSYDSAPIIMALMTLLLVNALSQRQHLEEMRQVVMQPKQDFFQIDLSNEQQRLLTQHVELSQDIVIMGTVLGRTIENYYDTFERKLQSGHTIRIVLIDPNSPACQMTVKRLSVPTNLDSWRDRIMDAIKALEMLRQKTNGNLEIRTIDYHLAYGGICTDLDTPEGVIFLWYHSFKTRKTNRPKFLLRPQNEYWYSYFKEEIDSIWHSAVIWQDERTLN